MLQACLNGARTRHEHHHLPVRPEELAQAAATSAAAGATALHLHPKTTDGTDTLDPHVVATTLRVVRAAAPGLPLSITTGTWTAPEPRDRIRAIRTWTTLPDQATVHWHEPGADDLTRALLDRGIAVHAALHSGTDAHEHFLRSPLHQHTERILAHVSDPTARGAQATAHTLLHRLRTLPTPLLLHGRSAGAWPVLTLALRRGHDIRIGLQDTLHLPDGRIATDNAELITAATHLATSQPR